MEYTNSGKQSNLFYKLQIVLIIILCIAVPILTLYEQDFNALNILSNPIFCMFLIATQYFYISPLIHKKINSPFFITVMLLCIFSITTIYYNIYEYNIFEYPLFINRSELSHFQKIALFSCVALLLFFASQFIYLYLKTHNMSIENYDLMLSSYSDEMTEIRMSRSPIFLYNSSNKLYELLKKERFEDAEFFATAIGHLLNRQITYANSDKISIEEEIEWLNEYLEVHKKIFNSSLSFNIIIENQELIIEEIPPLISQEILELLLANSKENQSEQIEIKYSSNHILHPNRIVLISYSLIENEKIPDYSGFSVRYNNLQQRIALLNKFRNKGFELKKAETRNGLSFTFEISETA